MKQEELAVFFDMSVENNDLLEEASRLQFLGGSNNNNNDNDRSPVHVSGESDEGCCDLNSSSSVVRRVKSTPNLLQIPSPCRNRKKSTDSALGSAEESETSSAENSPSESGLNRRTPPFHRSRSAITELSQDPGSPLLPLGDPARASLLRPPSVVVSDHDLCAHGGEEMYLTLEDLERQSQFQHRRRLSDASTCSSFSELDFQIGPPPEEDGDEPEPGKASKWRTIRSVVHFTPFIQTFKQSKLGKYAWVQLAGHQGNFKGGRQPGTILKKYCEREKFAFERMENDATLKPFVPQYYGLVKEDECEFIQLEDLLGQFINPCVMDCKMGVRTYLEEELMKAKEKPKLRKDMYEKMCQIDPNAPLPEEHRVHGVTKPRYMVWRETISTTATLGFRIEGIRKGNETSKDFKTVRSQEKVKEAFSAFVGGHPSAIRQYLDRLYTLRNSLKTSRFFATHEVIGSSLLFVHDDTKALVWMIDFAKTIPLPEGIKELTHDKMWNPGNHEDGYLIGLSNLIKIFEEIHQTNLRQSM